MNWLGTFTLLRPEWLLALPLAWVLMRLTRAAAQGLVDWERAVDPALLAAMVRRGGRKGSGRSAGDGVFMAALLIVAALSGPAILRADTNQLRNLDATLVLVDLSEQAVQGQMLAQARTLALRVLEQPGGRQLGLIVYAGDAYLASPLTRDVAATTSLLFALDATTVPDPGVRPQRALAMARQILAEAKILSGDIVLISSGGGLPARALGEAQAIGAAGQSLHTLYVHPPAGADAARQASLAAMASAGKGVAGDAAHAGAVLAAINDRAVFHSGQSALGVLAFQDFGRWLLLLAAAPLLLAFRRAAI